MNIFKKIWGKIIYSVASIISIIFDIFISIIGFIIKLVKGIGMGLFYLFPWEVFVFYHIRPNKESGKQDLYSGLNIKMLKGAVAMVAITGAGKILDTKISLI